MSYLGTVPKRLLVIALSWLAIMVASPVLLIMFITVPFIVMNPKFSLQKEETND